MHLHVLNCLVIPSRDFVYTQLFYSQEIEDSIDIGKIAV